MRLLSIDVGIKNLAYCLFYVNNENDYSIESWKIVNLCNETKHECCSLNNQKKKCTRSCKFYKNNLYY